MEIKESAKIGKGKYYLRKANGFFFRWFRLALFLAVAAYSVWIWDKYVYRPDWSEEKKQEYIKEQSVFSFDRDNYEKAINQVRSKKERLESSYRFSGRDIFFPEGF
ncbi:MAG: hypothetical protein WC831_05200 [Parcubacteria group bacterium]|jgi:cytoskeletal protein RodZ